MAATSWATLAAPDAVNLAVVTHLAPVDLVAADEYLVAVTHPAQVDAATLAVQLHLPTKTMVAQLDLVWV